MARAVRKPAEASDSYTAADIEVLEGLEPVRRRPGMYVGGTDEKALHHLFAEVIDNCMDEAVAGHATWIEVELEADGFLTVTDNGRGVPVDPHPKFKTKSALEVIMTTLHSGGKFDSKVYNTSGGLHGVGVSVVNALSEKLEVEVARGQQLYAMAFSRGAPQGKLQKLGAGQEPARHQGALQAGREDLRQGRHLQAAAPVPHGALEGLPVRRRRDPLDLRAGAHHRRHAREGHVPFPRRPEGISGSHHQRPDPRHQGPVRRPHREGRAGTARSNGRCAGWPTRTASSTPTATPSRPPRAARTRTACAAPSPRACAISASGSATSAPANITADDVLGTAAAMLSVFIREPEFQGQTKDKLATQEATRIVENAVRDAFDHWLADSPQQANKLLDWAIDQAEDRLKRKREKEIGRQSATRKLRLPGKLADCSMNSKQGTEIFIVEGDSAGGSAKQARNRESQAILPLRGKILNVANASSQKLSQNQLLSDLIQALGVGTGSKYRDEDLRYERVIIMTDADVDGAHIASLLITFFYQEMPELIEQRPPVPGDAAALQAHPRRQVVLRAQRQAQGRSSSRASSPPTPRSRSTASRGSAR